MRHRLHATSCARDIMYMRHRMHATSCTRDIVYTRMYAVHHRTVNRPTILGLAVLGIFFRETYFCQENVYFSLIILLSFFPRNLYLVLIVELQPDPRKLKRWVQSRTREFVGYLQNDSIIATLCVFYLITISLITNVIIYRWILIFTDAGGTVILGIFHRLLNFAALLWFCAF